MKRVLIFGIILICLVSSLTFVGCGKTAGDATGPEDVQDAPNMRVPCIIHQGIMYRITDELIPDAEIDESMIVGKITSVVRGSELPAQNGEANFGELGMSYALVTKGLSVRLNDGWRLFVQADW